MRKIRVNKGNETKSNIFPQDAFEFDFDFFGQKICISVKFKIQISHFYDKSKCAKGK